MDPMGVLNGILAKVEGEVPREINLLIGEVESHDLEVDRIRMLIEQKKTTYFENCHEWSSERKEQGLKEIQKEAAKIAPLGKQKDELMVEVKRSIEKLRKSIKETPEEESDEMKKGQYCWCKLTRPPGELMIACDNKKCEFEWFHGHCVNIDVAPPGDWFCSPKCQEESIASTSRKRHRNLLIV